MTETSYQKLKDSPTQKLSICGLCKRRKLLSKEDYLENLDKIIKTAHMKALKDNSEAQTCYQLARLKYKEGDADYAKCQLQEREYLLQQYRKKLAYYHKLKIIRHKIEEIEDIRHLGNVFGDANDHLKDALKSVDHAEIARVMEELEESSADLQEISHRLESEEVAEFKIEDFDENDNNYDPLEEGRKLEELLNLPLPPTKTPGDEETEAMPL